MPPTRVAAGSLKPNEPLCDKPTREYIQTRRLSQDAADGDVLSPPETQAPTTRSLGAKPNLARSRSAMGGLSGPTFMDEAKGLSGVSRTLCMSIADVESSPGGLRHFLWPLVLFTLLALTAALMLNALIFWTPAYRYYWEQKRAALLSQNETAALLERYDPDFPPLPEGCQRFDKNSERLTEGVETLLDATFRTPFEVDALPNEPQSLGPGSRLVLDSLVVEEVHHGRWTFGVCWDSPWYQTMPDQLVLRLRRIGITATLSMHITQHVPFHGDVVLSYGSATVVGEGVVFLDEIDLQRLAQPVQSCKGRFLFTMQGASFGVGGYSAGIGTVLDSLDVGAVFPVQDVLCFGGGGATSLSSLDAQRAAAAAAAARRDARADGGAHGQLDAANATGTGAAGMVNEIVWDMMPQIHQGTELLLLASSATVVVAMLALLGLVVAITAYVNDSPRALVPVALVTTALCGLVLKLGREEPLAGATGCFVVLVLFSAWRLLACASCHVREAAASPRGAARLAAGCACIGLLGRLAYEYRGTTGSRWLLLIYVTLSASLGGVALLAPFCLSRSLAGFGAVSSAWKRQALRSADGIEEKRESSLTTPRVTAARIRARLHLFHSLNVRLGGMPRCYASMLAALLLAIFVVIFYTLEFSRELNSRTHFVSPPPPPYPPWAPYPPAAPPLPAAPPPHGYSYYG